MHTLFYFTGTGNCLSVTQKLEERFSEEINTIRICKKNMELSKKQYRDVVGIVYPVYSNNLPFMVLEFLQNLNLAPNTYVYTIVTWGGLRGTTDKIIHRLIDERGGSVSADFALKMPHNGIVIFDSPSKEDQKKMLNTIDTQIDQIVKEVNGRRLVRLQTNFILKIILPKKQKYPNHIFNPQKREKYFFADDKCISCGICVKVCPAEDIKLIDGKPQWNGKCENCMACFQWCPKQAIQFKNVTQKRTRYHNPYITIDEILVNKK